MSPIDKQQLAINKIMEGKNIFLTGGAGTGKTTTTRKIIDLFPSSTVVCAPTGAAALNIGGMTVHKMFGLPIGIPTDSEKVNINSKVRKLFASSLVKLIVIDEVSMLRADYLDLIDIKLKTIKRNNKPFGGIQVVVVGDFFQLDPVVSREEEAYFYAKYSSSFCFTSDCWDFETVILDKLYRTKDERQGKILNSIRAKDRHHKLAVLRVNEESKQYLPNEDVLHLCCYKKDAVRVNNRRYELLKGSEKQYEATSTGEWSDPPVEKVLSFKVGCSVIIRANCQEGEYVNGDRGVIISLSNSSVVVELVSGNRVGITPFKWERHKYSNVKGKLTKEVEASFTQIPLRLGYAITGHAAQGSTLEDVALDFGRGAFTHGQAYCMLSRIKDIRNIRLVKPLTTRDVICNNDVVEFYKE